jgi:hypothetical protein
MSLFQFARMDASHASAVRSDALCAGNMPFVQCSVHPYVHATYFNMNYKVRYTQVSQSMCIIHITLASRLLCTVPDVS